MGVVRLQHLEGAQKGGFYGVAPGGVEVKAFVRDFIEFVLACFIENEGVSLKTLHRDIKLDSLVEEVALEENHYF